MMLSPRLKRPRSNERYLNRTPCPSSSLSSMKVTPRISSAPRIASQSPSAVSQFPA
jgi:hypothetical protein